MKINKRNNYERLEFLGDAVLEMISSEILFEEYPLIPEGGLTKKRAALVCEPSLANCARHMELGRVIFLGKGEARTGGNDKDAILCDVVEAILGAIYLDGGFEAAKAYVTKKVLPDAAKTAPSIEAKSTLQEIVPKHYPGVEPVYELISTEGPAHDATFTVSVNINNEIVCEGTGKTKRAAEQEAAKKAISIIKERETD